MRICPIVMQGELEPGVKGRFRGRWTWDVAFKYGKWVC